MSLQPTLSRFKNAVTGRELNRLWRDYERSYIDELGMIRSLVIEHPVTLSRFVVLARPTLSTTFATAGPRSAAHAFRTRPQSRAVAIQAVPIAA
jgi:hypothetical protein